MNYHGLNLRGVDSLLLNAKLSLIFEIEKKRKEMFECARQKGMHSLECVQKSQELDRLILQVQRQKMKFE